MSVSLSYFTAMSSYTFIPCPLCVNTLPTSASLIANAGSKSSCTPIKPPAIAQSNDIFSDLILLTVAHNGL